MKIDGVIFDVDGTVWDSTFVVEKAWNKALEECGYEERVTADVLKGLFGLPMLDIITRIIPYETLEKKEKFLELCSRYEFDFLNAEGGRVYEGFVEMLEELSKKYKLAVVSNCQAGYIPLVYEKTGIGKYFVDQACPDDTGKLKAENIKIIAERNGMKNPVYVGDTGMDEAACDKAGVPFVFASYGFGKAEHPWAVIDKPADLGTVLLS